MVKFINTGILEKQTAGLAEIEILNLRHMKKLATILFLSFVTLFSCTIRDGELIDLINAVKKENEELKDQIAALKKTTDSALVAISKVNALQATTDKKIELIQAELKTLLAQIASLNTQMSSQNADMVSLKAKIDALQIKCAELVAQITALNALNSSSSVRMGIGVNYLDYSPAEYQDTTKWHYVAILFNSNRRTEIYVDGIKKVDYFRPDLNYNFSKLYLGASLYTSFGNFYNGAIDELRISNGIRNQNEIQEYYIKSKGVDGVPVNPKQNIDISTIGMWHFDESDPTTSFKNSVTGTSSGSLFGSTKFISGISGNALFFDGNTGRADCNFNPPETNITIEFWFKSSAKKGTMIQPYGIYSSDILLVNF